MKAPKVGIGSLAHPERGSFKIGPFGSSLKKTELVDAGIPVIGIENVLAKKFTPPFRQFITEEKYEQLSKYSVRPGDVLVTTMGTIGRAAVVPENVETMIIDSHLFRMRVDQSKIYPPYLCYALNDFTDLKLQLKRKSRVAIMAGLNTTILKECTIPLPPLPEQQRIAAILAKADRLRRLRRTARDLSDTYLQSIFLEMFGDPVSNRMGWETVEMGAQIESIRYGTGSPPKYQKEGIPFIRATNIKKGTVQETDLIYISETEARSIAKCRVSAGDLILVRSGVNTGDCALIPPKFDGAYAAYDLIIQMPYPQNCYYNFIINSDHGKSIIRPLSRRAGQPHINADQLIK